MKTFNLPYSQFENCRNNCLSVRKDSLREKLKANLNIITTKILDYGVIYNCKLLSDDILC